MKQAKEIINHILAPFESKINIHRCLKKIISLMPKNYKKYITNAVYKGNVLYINVSHPALRQEIFYNRGMIFDIIKILHKNSMCKEINPIKIITNYKYSPPPKPPKIVKFYIKKAGDFEIKAKNPKIKKLFEEIKEIYKGENC